MRPLRLLALAGVLAVLFLADAVLVLAGPHLSAELDRHWAQAAVDITGSTPWVLQASLVADQVGGGQVLTGVVAVVVLVLLLLRRPAPAAYLVLSAAGGALLVTTVKALVGRPRPPWNGQWVLEATSSFPSGHAAAGISTVVALGVVALVVLPAGWRWVVAVPLFVVGPCIGLTRTLLGVHWISDVVGGWLIGAAWTCTAAAIVLAVALRVGPHPVTTADRGEPTPTAGADGSSAVSGHQP